MGVDKTNVLLMLSLLVSSHLQNTNGQNSSGLESDEMFRSVWSGYEKAVRPLCGTYPATTTVSLELALRQLQELNEPKQIITLNVWLRVAWSDCRLAWNTSVWNASRLVVPYNSIWTPDLTLYDNAKSVLEGMDSYRVQVSADGSLKQQVPVVIHSLCQLDVSRFPFDTQICNLTFGSWAYHGYEVNLTEAARSVDLSTFVKHGEWQMVSLTAQRIQPFFAGLPYPQVIFTLTLHRRHLFYVLSLLFPCALIQMMAALAFLLPPDTNEKVGLELTVLLSLAVMQLVVLNLIPPSSETLPLIGVYFMLAMIVVALSCLMTVIVLALHFPERHWPMPKWARALVRSKVARWFGIPTHKLKPDHKVRNDRKGVDVTSSSNPDLQTNEGKNSCSDIAHPNTELALVPQSKENHLHASKNTNNSAFKITNELPPITNSHKNALCNMRDELFTTCTQDKSANKSMQPTTDDAIVEDPVLTFRANDVSSDDISTDNQLDNQLAHYYGSEKKNDQQYSNEGAACLAKMLGYSYLLQEKEGERRLIAEVCLEILQHLKSEEDPEVAMQKLYKKEWRMMAMFLDRVFLIVFCVLTFIVFTYVYASIA